MRTPAALHSNLIKTERFASYDHSKSSAADEIYARQIGQLDDQEMLRLMELIGHELARRDNGRRGGLTSAADRQAARERFRRHAGAVSIGHASGADNVSIDADVAQEYGAGSGSA